MPMLNKQEKDILRLMLDNICHKIELYSPEDLDSMNDSTAPEFKLPTPKEVYDELNRYVIGQERAKKIMSVAAHNHYKRLLIYKDSKYTKKLDKTNCMLMGPTGSGKTFIVKKLSEFLKVPYFIADANSLTASGYVGKDVDSVIEGLLTSAKDNAEAAATGIVFIDEVDKISKKTTGSGKKDPGGESVQQALLKMIEGTTVEIERTKGIMKEKVTIDTSNIMFIFGGAFVGIEDIIKKRLGIKGKTSGFTIQPEEEKKEVDKILHEVTPDDIEEFGFIPEFLGRIPLVATLDELSEEDLYNILSKVEDNAIDQYKDLFDYSEKDLTFEDPAIWEMAKLAKEMKTGARSLKTIMETVLLESMFELEDCNVTKEYVENVYAQIRKYSKAGTS